MTRRIAKLNNLQFFWKEYKLFKEEIDNAINNTLTKLEFVIGGDTNI
ncbi:MAG: hypothetical protein IJB70_03025 [Clostridia bacterium]|nr:hypothetical protein [Clostridia bacterium]